jgi:pimeloyl-ACP methyl ester carboxylesterase
MESPQESRRVVLVHGAHDSARSFEPVADLLSDLDVVTYTRRGWGLDEDLAPVALATHVDDLLDVLDEQPATVVGHSWGGNVAMGAAIRRPDLVRSLGVFETAVLWLPGWPEEHAGHLRRAIGRVEAKLDESPERRAHRMMFLNEANGSLTKQIDPSEVRVRALVGVGGASMQSFIGGMRILADRWDTDVFEIPDATHMAHREHPEEFAEFVRLTVSRAATA